MKTRDEMDNNKAYFTHYKVDSGYASPLYPGIPYDNEEDYYPWEIAFGDVKIFSPSLKDGEYKVTNLVFDGYEFKLKETF